MRAGVQLLDIAITLAVASDAHTKSVWQFLEPQRTACADEYIQQDLEAAPRSLSHNVVNDFTPHHEEAAHGLLEVDP